MTFDDAKKLLCCDCNVEAMKFNLTLVGALLNVDDLEQLLNMLAIYYHDSNHDADFTNDAMRGLFCSDVILDALAQLVDDATYGIFKDNLHSSKLVELLQFMKSKAKLAKAYQHCNPSHMSQAYAAWQTEPDNYEAAIDKLLQKAS